MDSKSKKSTISAPNIIRDQIDPMVSHADGLIYDSKSNYYKSLKAQNFEIIGNETQPERKELKFDEKRLEASILYAMAQHNLIDISQLSIEQIEMIEKEFFSE